MSNAINSVINLVDAVCVHASGTRSASTNHGDAVRLLGGIESLDTAIREALGERLAALLSAKNLAQSEGALIEKQEAEGALKEMDRAFAAAKPVARSAKWE